MTVKNIIASWNRIELLLIGTLGAAALAIALYMMATRYWAAGLSIDWGEEMIIYLLVWATWLSGSRLVFDQAHIQTDLVFKRLNTQTQHVLQLVHMTLGLFFSAVMVWGGIVVVNFALVVGEQTESSIHFPLWLYYLAVPIGLSLMALRYGYEIFRLYNTRNDE